MLQNIHMHKGVLGTKIVHADNQSARLIDHVMVLATSGELSIKEYRRTREDILKNMELAQNASELLVQNTIELTDNLAARRKQKFVVMENTMQLVMERQKQQQTPTWKDVVSKEEEEINSFDVEHARHAELVNMSEEYATPPHTKRAGLNWNKRKKDDLRKKWKNLPKPKKF